MSGAKLAIVQPAPPVIPPPPNAKEHWFSRAKDGSLVFNGRTYDDHVGAWGDAQNAIDGGLWGQALVAASLVTKYGESDVKKFASDVKRSAAWIYDMARAYRVFGENSSQLDYLSFTHHVEAAKLAKDGDLDAAREALIEAHDGEWSTKELQNFVENGIRPEPKKTKKVKLGPELVKIHADAVRNELTAKVAILRQWPEESVDPLLAAVYRRCVSMLDWQRERTVETDCAAIMEIFTAEEGMELPDCVSKNYIQAWLNLRGRLMNKNELAERIETLQKLRMLTDFSRKKSKGPTQRGVVTPVYAPCDDYMALLEDVAFMSQLSDRRVALHNDWIERAKKHAPELLPEEQEAQAA